MQDLLIKLSLPVLAPSRLLFETGLFASLKSAMFAFSLVCVLPPVCFVTAKDTRKASENIYINLFFAIAGVYLSLASLVLFTSFFL